MLTYFIVAIQTKLSKKHCFPDSISVHKNEYKTFERGRRFVPLPDFFRRVYPAEMSPSDLCNFNNTTGCCNRLLNLVGFFFCNIFFKEFGSALNEVFRFLESKSGNGADFLDYGDLL